MKSSCHTSNGGTGAARNHTWPFARSARRFGTQSEVARVYLRESADFQEEDVVVREAVDVVDLREVPIYASRSKVESSKPARRANATLGCPYGATYGLMLRPPVSRPSWFDGRGAHRRRRVCWVPTAALARTARTFGRGVQIFRCGREADRAPSLTRQRTLCAQWTPREERGAPERHKQESITSRRGNATSANFGTRVRLSHTRAG